MFDLSESILMMGIARIHDMQQEYRLARFCQRGPESCDQLVRQIAHEPDRVDEQNLLARVQP